MSNIIPSYYRYISGLVIANAGSGFTSVPDIVISGGGGTGGAAVAEIFNGRIIGVTLTNIGTGYTTSPNVAVVGGGGSGAVITANVSFASGVGEIASVKASSLIDKDLPEFVRQDHPEFTNFIKKYVAWMDQAGNPNNILLNKKYNDIDSATEAELLKWQNQLGRDLPNSLAVDKKTLLKRLKDLYETKGSRRSIELFFRLLFDEEVTVYYPQEELLRASDGRWVEDKAIRVSGIAGQADLLSYQGKLIDIHVFKTVGTLTTSKIIEATVTQVEKIAYSKPTTYEFIVQLPAGTTNIDGPGADASLNINVTAGVITSVDVLIAGSGYNAAPVMEIYDSAGTGADLRVIVEGGKIASVTVADGGSGYVDPEYILNYDSIQTYVALRGETVPEGYLIRTLNSVTTVTPYTGDNLNLRVGNIFEINESGDDGRGYALDYFAEEYTYIGGDNGAYIRVERVDATGMPTLWSIVQSGSGFLGADTNLTITTPSGLNFDIELITGYLYSYPGKYLNDRGKLSDVNRLQDNRKYQKYSYVVKTGIPQSRWNKSIRELVHPAGMEVFGDLIIKHNIDFGANLSIATDGVTFSKFFATDDVNASVIVVRLDIYKNFSEALNVSESVSKTFGINKQDTTTQGESVLQLFETSKSDTANVSQIFDRVVDYNREFQEAQNVTDIFASLISYNRTFTENQSTSELIAKVLGKAESETVSISENTVYDMQKGIQESLTAVGSFGLEFNQGTITDSVTATSLPAITAGIVPYEDEAQTFEELHILTNSYAAQDYFLEDYVGSIISYINKHKKLVLTASAIDSVALNTTTTLTPDSTSSSDSGILNLQDYAGDVFGGDYVGSGYGI